MIENELMLVPLAAQRRPLREHLRETSAKHAHRQRHYRLDADLLEQRYQNHSRCDEHHVEHRRRRGGDEELVQRVQHAHERGGHRDHDQERHVDPREFDGEFEFALDRSEVFGVAGSQRTGKHDPEQHENARNEQQAVDHLRSQAERRLLAFAGERAGERGNECGAHRAFGKQLTKERGDACGDHERIGAPVGAKEVGLRLVADETEDSAGEGGRANEASRFGQAVFHR